MNSQYINRFNFVENITLNKDLIINKIKDLLRNIPEHSLINNKSELDKYFVDKYQLALRKSTKRKFN